MSDELDIITNEIEQGFMQRGGWKACRHLLRKLVNDKDSAILRLQRANDLNCEALDEKIAELARLQTALEAIEISYKGMQERAEEAEAVVEKLPKTADGVSIVPGMTVYIFVGGHIDEREVRGPYGLACLLVREPARHGACEGTRHELAGSCYSTREAAETAREKP